MSKGKHRQNPDYRQEFIYLKRTLQNRWYAFWKPALRKWINEWRNK